MHDLLIDPPDDHPVEPDDDGGNDESHGSYLEDHDYIESCISVSEVNDPVLGAVL